VCRFLRRGSSSVRRTFVGLRVSAPRHVTYVASRDIRGQIDQLIQSVTTLVASEWNAVNSTFSDRIAEYVDARNKIQAHLSKVSLH